MTVVSLLRISDKLRCDFPPGLSGIKNGAPIFHKWAEAGVVVLLRCGIMGSSRIADLSASSWNQIHCIALGLDASRGSYNE
jgi:hypothetical protein